MAERWLKPFKLSVDVVKFMRMAKDRIPNLCGIKHSSKDLPNAHGCKLIDDGKLQVLNGTDNVSHKECQPLFDIEDTF